MSTRVVFILKMEWDIAAYPQYFAEEVDDMIYAGAYHSADDALEKIQGAAPDVVVVDLDMTEGDAELLNLIWLLLPAVRFIIRSAQGDRQDILKVINWGASGFVSSRSPEEELVNCIRLAMQGRWSLCRLSQDILKRSLAAEIKKDCRKEFGLTPREAEVIYFLERGLSYKQIADTLFISVDTVRKHCSNIYEKLGVSNKTEAINKVFPRPSF